MTAIVMVYFEKFGLTCVMMAKVKDDESHLSGLLLSGENY